MLSDDEIWSRWKFPTDLSWKQSVINLARAIEREVRRQALEEAAQPDAVEALRWEKPGPVSPNHPLECLIVLSAIRQRDGDWWIEGNKFLEDDLPIAWAPDTQEARAVLAAQGGDR